MPTSWLKVPHFRQTTDGTCLEACVCMILAYLQSPVEESKVCELFESDEIGTPSSRVLRLEQWDFKVTYGSTNLEQLRLWLTQRMPPIAFVQTQFLDYWAESTPHAVVVVGIDDEQVYLNDPAFDTTPQIASRDGFLAAWIEMDEVAAIIVPQS
jgi:ABC-type bacteriocin/lantibiotic exporter with double-glycine peptidase domain